MANLEAIQFSFRCMMDMSAPGQSLASKYHSFARIINRKAIIQDRALVDEGKVRKKQQYEVFQDRNKELKGGGGQH